MNPLNIFGRLFRSLDRTIDTMDRKLAQSIKNGFYFLIFCLSIAAMIIGGMKGREAAKIKSPPLIRGTDDVFAIQRERADAGGSFSDMLESDMINELKSGNPEKSRPKSREGLRPDSDFGPFEVERDKKRRTAADITVDDNPVEGDYIRKDLPRSDVKTLDRKWGRDREKEGAKDDEAPELKSGDDSDLKMPAPDEGVSRRGTDGTGDPRDQKKKRPLYRSGQKGPGTLYHDPRGAE